MPTIINPYRAAALDGDAFKLCKAFTTPPAQARTAAISTLIAALKTGGIWAPKLDRLHILGAHVDAGAATSQASLLDWKSAAKALTISGSPTFTADRGYTGDGAAAFLTAPDALNTYTKFQQNDCHWGVWSLTDASNDNYHDIGTTAGSNAYRFNPRNTAGSATGNLNAAGAETHAVANSIGHFVHNRTGASATEMFKDGVSLGTDTDASSAVTTGQLTILQNRGLTFSVRQLMCVHVGASLTSGEVTALYNALNAFKTHLGA